MQPMERNGAASEGTRWIGHAVGRCGSPEAARVLGVLVIRFGDSLLGVLVILVILGDSLDVSLRSEP